MRFQQILEAQAKIDPKIEVMFHNIYQNCQPYLKAVKNKPYDSAMFRGIKHADEDFGKKDVRLANRKPVDTGKLEHNQLNAALEELYGHPYRNGLFVSGNWNVASAYGDLYSVFPIGKFEYIWHEYIDDLYSKVGGYDEAFDAWQEFAREIIDPKKIEAHIEVDKEEDEEEWTDQYFQVVDDMIPEVIDKYGTGELLKWVLKHEGSYKQDDLVLALSKPRKEIMIWVPSYYYMNTDYLPLFQKWLSK